VSEENLKQRLVYFEGRLEEAKRRYAAKELYSRNFTKGFTTETLKSWPDSIALINERILGIQFQLRAK
jgi:hypothetical protein